MQSMKKKGVSPLIATVLLIAFAVALGAVVMNWGRTYVENTAGTAAQKSDTAIRCSMDVRISMLEIDDVEQLCFCNTSATATDSYIDFTFENTGLVDLSDIQLTLVGTGGVITNSSFINTTIKKADVIKQKIRYNRDVIGILQQVRLIPQVKQGNELIPCSDRVVVKGTNSFTNCTSCNY